MPPVPRGAPPVRRRRGRRATLAACTAILPVHGPPWRGAPRVEGTREGEDRAARPSQLPPPPREHPRHRGRGWD